MTLERIRRPLLITAALVSSQLGLDREREHQNWFFKIDSTSLALLCFG